MVCFVTLILLSANYFFINKLFFCPRISRIFVQASAEGKFTWTMSSAAENVKKFTRNMLNYINGDLIGRTNFH